MVLLAKTEIGELHAWFIEHIRYCSREEFKIEQTSKSGIGTNSYVICACGMRRDITDYSNW